jgi:tripartite-type tricarboxylate transporter receptor subunit TctC
LFTRRLRCATLKANTQRSSPFTDFAGDDVMKALWLTFAALVLIHGATPIAHAQPTAKPNWPVRPVRLVVGFSTGGPMDISARLIGPKLAEMWGQPVVIENRTGAGGSIATVMVAQSTADGHTLLLTSASHAINAVLRPKSGYDPLRDFASISQIGYSTSALVVPPSLNVKSVKELIALANEKPGSILYGSAGAGSGTHFTTERFNLAAGIKGKHVAFKGQSEMTIEILAGRLHFGVPTLGVALGMIREGRLRALAVVTPRRSPQLPDVPAMVEILPNFKRDAAHLLLAPAKTPRAVVLKISHDIARLLDMPDIRKQMEAIDFTPAATTPEELDKIIREMMVIFEEVARAAGMK